MKVIISLEHRFLRTPDGRVWTQTAFAYSFWLWYLKVFDRVCVVARVQDLASVPSDWKRADGDMVSFAAVPCYSGPVQYLLMTNQINQVVRSAIEDSDAIILRVPSELAMNIKPLMRWNNRPFAVEVVADPFDIFAPGAIQTPLRPFLRWWFTWKLQQDCFSAMAAAYVTKHTLQHRYPCPNFSRGISDIVLPDESIVAMPRPPHRQQDEVILVFVGTMSQLYKAPDVLIKAVSFCVKAGLNLKLLMLGDGKYRPQLENLAKAEGVGDRVKFFGQVAAGDAVQTQLDRADLFVLPSLTEGLPRVIIEAMARALPCIASNVGGIPELLPSEDLFAPGDVNALATKITEVVNNPDRMAQMSARNLAKALDYKDVVLKEQRIEFYSYVRKQTEAWLSSQK
jgi:L-malate glycosyltransferase